MLGNIIIRIYIKFFIASKINFNNNLNIKTNNSQKEVKLSEIINNKSIFIDYFFSSKKIYAKNV